MVEPTVQALFSPGYRAVMTSNVAVGGAKAGPWKGGKRGVER